VDNIVMSLDLRVCYFSLYQVELILLWSI